MKSDIYSTSKSFSNSGNNNFFVVVIGFDGIVASAYVRRDYSFLTAICCYAKRSCVKIVEVGVTLCFIVLLLVGSRCSWSGVQVRRVVFTQLSQALFCEFSGTAEE